MNITFLEFLGIALFFIGWLINFYEGRALIVAKIGAIVFLLAWALSLAPIH